MLKADLPRPRWDDAQTRGIISPIIHGAHSEYRIVPSGLATRTVPTCSEHAERRTRYQIPNDVECQEFTLGNRMKHGLPPKHVLILYRPAIGRGGHVHIVPAKEHNTVRIGADFDGRKCSTRSCTLSLSLSCQCTTCGAGSVCNKSEYTKECRCYREHCSHVQLGCGC